ncbi:hypothetical protein BT96DRAFT_990557 [Gymnopus androsaceus JB14]|uniref:Uncharacterized protein n=1 Tax=Gymnopus androsaceus JB14 TaxID=1447944 RepID=A0A6A4I0Y6_9AGAR|nr:hypothetical protein BT96DRAFT_990557 [Gymnopus androsaceus JB14]
MLRFESTSNHAVMRLYRKSDLFQLSGFQAHDRDSLPSTPTSARERPNTVLSMAKSDNAKSAEIWFGNIYSRLLPPYLPPAEESRQQLVHAIRKLEVVRNRNVKGRSSCCFFAYAMAMKGVTQELQSLGRVLQDAFGVISQSADEFDTTILFSSL